MKYIKYIIIVIFLAATITYVINWAYTKSHTNESAPVISVDNAGQVKKVSVKDKDTTQKPDRLYNSVYHSFPLCLYLPMQFSNE